LKWDFEYDIVIAGSGVGALTAAIIASDLGLSVGLFEKSEFLGGASSVTNGEVWVPCNPIELEEGFKDSEAQSEKYFRALSCGLPVSTRVRRAWLRASRSAVLYLRERANLKWRVIRGLPDVLYGSVDSALPEGRYLEVEPFDGSLLGAEFEKIQKSPLVPYGITNEEMLNLSHPRVFHKMNFGKRLCQGPGLVAYLIRGALKRKIDIFESHRLVRLLKVRNRVIGGIIRKKNGVIHVRANHALLLSIGGYGWHPQYSLKFEQLPEWHCLLPPTVEGDSLLIASDVGAAYIPYKVVGGRPGYNIPNERWFGKPVYRSLINEAGYPHSIIVNSNGKRFADESNFQELADKSGSFDRFRGFINYPFFFIFDEQYRNKYNLGPIGPGEPLPPGLVVSSRTIEDLAMKLDIPSSSLMKTVSDFNAFARNGIDSEFGRGTKAWSRVFSGDRDNKPNPNLGTIEVPPFYGMRLTYVGAGYNAGYMVDKEARVINVQGKPITSLYACGNCVSFFDVGPVYQDGISLAKSIGLGYLAACSAARDAGKNSMTYE
jgi:3-oxosteroid 1-dehydrogenase